MLKSKKIVSTILVLTIIIYYMLGIFINNKVYAVERNRTSDLNSLENSSYPGVLALINELKKSHPNWTFTVLYTGLDWSNVIYKETSALHGRSLVQNSSAGWTCPTCGSTPYDNGTWYCASPTTVSYYMDIRNWLSESYIFAFETLSYDSSTQTIDGVKKRLSGTFMDRDSINYYDTEGNMQTINKSYAQIIMEAAAEAKVSPYHLASRVKQEQGSGGSSLISGKYTYTDGNGNTITDLRGYYNYFNIGASGGNSATIIRNGLNKAKSKGWTTPELAIKGGATFLAAEYISNYQDCLYLEKYQVDSAGGLYSHQYMQNVSAPFSEGYTTYKAYRDMGMLDYSFNFIIPVYENMPTTVSPMPNSVAMDIVTENVKVTTAYSALKVRSSASSSSTLIGSLDKGTVVLRIEKATAMSSDGRYWDKVVYNTGSNLIVGYAARTDTDGSKYLTEVEDVITTNEKAITTTDVNLRNGPGLTGTTVKKTLPKDLEVTIIDKIGYEINGYIWYRVKISDGTQGYLAAEYLTSNIEPKEKYKIKDKNILIAPGTKIDDIEGAKLNGSILGTGAQVTLNGEQYILVVIGDTNGDGEITPLDYVKVKNHIMNISTLNNCYNMAADANEDGNITPLDYVKIKNHIMQVKYITL